jgi:uncharacterized membrane protein
MFTFGLIFSKHPPKKMNPLFGYRSSRSMVNEKTWEYAHHQFGTIGIKISLFLCLITGITMISLYDSNNRQLIMYSLFVILIQTIMLIVSIYETEKRLIEAFDKEGNKKF